MTEELGLRLREEFGAQQCLQTASTSKREYEPSSQLSEGEMTDTGAKKSRPRIARRRIVESGAETDEPEEKMMFGGGGGSHDDSERARGRDVM